MRIQNMVPITIRRLAAPIALVGFIVSYCLIIMNSAFAGPDYKLESNGQFFRLTRMNRAGTRVEVKVKDLNELVTNPAFSEDLSEINQFFQRQRNFHATLFDFLYYLNSTDRMNKFKNTLTNMKDSPISRDDISQLSNPAAVKPIFITQKKAGQSFEELAVIQNDGSYTFLDIDMLRLLAAADRGAQYFDKLKATMLKKLIGTADLDHFLRFLSTLNPPRTSVSPGDIVAYKRANSLNPQHSGDSNLQAIMNDFRKLSVNISTTGRVCNPRPSTQGNRTAAAPAQLQQSTPHSLTLPNGHLQTIHELSRKELNEKYDQAYRDMVFRMLNSRDTVIRNKGLIFERLMQTGQNFPPQEIIQIKKSSGAFKDYTLAFFGVNPNTGAPLVTSRPDVRFNSEWMNYSDSNVTNSFKSSVSDPDQYQVTYADFANQHLGGGYREHGFVQEEQMVAQSSDLAKIIAGENPAYDTSKLNVRQQLINNTGERVNIHSADPLLITNLRFGLNFDDDFARNSPAFLRSTHFHDEMDQHLSDESAAPPVNVIAYAAPKVGPNDRGKPYDLAMIKDMFNNAFLAFSMVKAEDDRNGRKTALIAGKWGAGVFGHSEQMSLAIQYLAAQMAGVHKIEFAGTDNTPANRASIQLINNYLEHILPVANTQPGNPPLSHLFLQLAQQPWRTQR